MSASPLILFIVPLKARANAKDWTATCAALQGTLDSIYQQSCGDFHVLIVCNEEPDVQIDTSRTTCILTDLQLKSNHPGARTLDKERRTQLGMIHAKRFFPKYVMFVDADDRISSELVAHVRSHPEIDGFILRQGYLHRLGSRWVVLLRRFHMSCGTNHIFRYRECDAPVSMEQSVRDFWMTKQSHNKFLEATFDGLGYRHAEVPFPAAVYIRGTGDSNRDHFNAWVKISLKSHVSGRMHKLRAVVRFLLRGKWLTDDIRQEFRLL